MAIKPDMGPVPSPGPTPTPTPGPRPRPHPVGPAIYHDSMTLAEIYEVYCEAEYLDEVDEVGGNEYDDEEIRDDDQDDVEEEIYEDYYDYCESGEVGSRSRALIPEICFYLDCDNFLHYYVDAGYILQVKKIVPAIDISCLKQRKRNLEHIARAICDKLQSSDFNLGESGSLNEIDKFCGQIDLAEDSFSDESADSLTGERQESFDFSEDQFRKKKTAKKLVQAITKDIPSNPFPEEKDNIAWLNKFLCDDKAFDILVDSNKVVFNRKKVLRQAMEECRKPEFDIDSEDGKRALCRRNRLLLEYVYPKQCPKKLGKHSKASSISRYMDSVYVELPCSSGRTENDSCQEKRIVPLRFFVMDPTKKQEVKKLDLEARLEEILKKESIFDPLNHRGLYKDMQEKFKDEKVQYSASQIKAHLNSDKSKYGLKNSRKLSYKYIREEYAYLLAKGLTSGSQLDRQVEESLKLNGQEITVPISMDLLNRIYSASMKKIIQIVEILLNEGIRPNVKEVRSRLFEEYKEKNSKSKRKEYRNICATIDLDYLKNLIEYCQSRQKRMVEKE